MADPSFLELLQPLDASNQELLGHVHPPEWTNPRPQDRYHLVVIGGGTAGLVSAAGAAGLGARVALIERRFLGGDCLNHGCVPSKALIRAARSWAQARLAATEFGGPGVGSDGDFSKVMERMRRLRAGISHHDSAQRFQDLGVDVFLGEGRFESEDSICVGDARLSFRRAIIATGARPVTPPIPGCKEGCFLTNETVFNLTQLPARLAVIGGGPIGCELAQSFARFGSQVTLLDMAPHLLPREDADASEIIQSVLARDGVRLELGVEVKKIDSRESGKTVHFERAEEDRTVEVDELLVAVGRAPNVEGLGLKSAGIDFDNFGIQVSDRLQTTNRRVYAVGDVASQYKFTHTADALARLAIQNALFFGRLKASDLIVPWCTYTSPEVAHVGLYEQEARDRGFEVDTITIPMANVDRAILDGDDEGFLRLHVQQGKDRILGATIVADHAGDLVSEVTLAMNAGVGLGKIGSTIHPYPTQAEVIKKAADTWRRGKLTPTVQKIFATFFRIFR